MGCCVIKNNPKAEPASKHSNTIDLQKKKTISAASSKIRVGRKNYIFEQNARVTENYKILDKIGHGSFGIVYKVLDSRLGLIRAMKIIHKDYLQSQDDQKLFLKEIEVLREIDHPNIIKIYEFFVDNQNFYIISEFAKGGQLYDIISKWKELSENTAAYIMKQILGAVFYLHSKKIVHRDIKTENIVVDDNEKGCSYDRISIKLIDFGSANYIQNEVMFNTAFGTPYYVAPEVIKNKYNEKCDIWSCGVVLYILLVGYPPFRADNKSDVLEKVAVGKYSLEHKEWMNVSEVAKNLIHQLLKYDYRTRISAEQALKHEWFTKFGNKESVISPTILQQTLKNIKNFNAQEIFQQAVVAYLSHFFANAQEIQDLKEIFQLLDINGDGRLAYKELEEGFKRVFGENLTDIEFNRIVKDLDQDEDGFIGYDEFLRVAMDKKSLISEENLKFAFEQFDSNQDGVLSKSDIKKVLGTNDSVVIYNLISNIDQNDDGVISFKEFGDLMKRMVTKEVSKRKTIDHSNIFLGNILQLSQGKQKRISNNKSLNLVNNIKFTSTLHDNQQLEIGESSHIVERVIMMDAENSVVE